MSDTNQLRALIKAIREYRRSPNVTNTNKLNDRLTAADRLCNEDDKQLKLFEPEDSPPSDAEVL